LKREGRDSLDFLETVLGVACCRSRSSEGVCFCLLACLLALSLYVDVAEAEGGAERSGRKIDVVAVPAWEQGGRRHWHPENRHPSLLDRIPRTLLQVVASSR
jgi:hypothetical protein